jgi:hypothetical protein
MAHLHLLEKLVDGLDERLAEEAIDPLDDQP